MPDTNLQQAYNVRIFDDSHTKIHTNDWNSEPTVSKNTLTKIIIFFVFNRLQKMVERGLLDRLQDKEWPLDEHVTIPSFEPVQLQQIIQITAILAVGMLLSLIILAIEILISKSEIKINKHLINLIVLVVYVIAILAALITMFA